MKKTIIYFLLFLPLMLFSQNNDTYEIYKTIINNNFKRVSIISMDQMTKIDYSNIDELEYKNFKRDLKTLKKETFDDFILKNSIPDTITNQFKNIKFEVLILSDSCIQSIFSQDDGWDIFYKKYGKTQGMLTFSRVGFDKNHSQALVYYGNQSDWLAGAGYYVVYDKKDGIWVETGYFMSWIS